MGVNFTARVKALQRELDAFDKKRVKAYQTAVKVEAARMVGTMGKPGLLRREIQAGAPGGRAFSPLSQIATKRRYRNKKKPPLYRLAVPVRYRTDYRDGGMEVSIGFVDPLKGPKLSKSWRRLAQLHQAGKRIPVTPDIRKAFITIAAGMQKRKNTRNQSNVFFLKKSTTSLNIPARPILEPFWSAHLAEAERNIVLNFHRKMQGERI